MGECYEPARHLPSRHSEEGVRDERGWRAIPRVGKVVLISQGYCSSKGAMRGMGGGRVPESRRDRESCTIFSDSIAARTTRTRHEHGLAMLQHGSDEKIARAGIWSACESGRKCSLWNRIERAAPPPRRERIAAGTVSRPRAGAIAVPT